MKTQFVQRFQPTQPGKSLWGNPLLKNAAWRLMPFTEGQFGPTPNPSRKREGKFRA